MFKKVSTGEAPRPPPHGEGLNPLSQSPRRRFADWFMLNPPYWKPRSAPGLQESLQQKRKSDEITNIANITNIAKWNKLHEM